MMKINGVIFISLLLIVLIGFNVQLSAQESVHAAGENGTGTGGSVSFTVGQIVYKTFTASGFEKSIVSSSEGFSFTNAISSGQAFLRAAKS